jgi:hypothetical protein
VLASHNQRFKSVFMKPIGKRLVVVRLEFRNCQLDWATLRRNEGTLINKSLQGRNTGLERKFELQAWEQGVPKRRDI